MSEKQRWSKTQRAIVLMFLHNFTALPSTLFFVITLWTKFCLQRKPTVTIAVAAEAESCSDCRIVVS